MKIKWLKIYLVHLLIIVVYLFATSFWFVKQDEHNPVGTGLVQWLFFIIHILLTAVICMVRLVRSTEKKRMRAGMFANLSAVVVWITVYLLLSEPVWRWLWKLRA